jgi:hypothetical protein
LILSLEYLFQFSSEPRDGELRSILRRKVRMSEAYLQQPGFLPDEVKNHVRL